MKLFSFEVLGQKRIGAEANGQLMDAPVCYAAMLQTRGGKPGGVSALPRDMIGFIRLGEPAVNAARESLSFMAKRPALPVGERASYLFEEVRLLPPIPSPRKILCSGLNYRSHVEENPNAKFL